MYFKRLEMHGFKSFAEPVVIDFHEGVTCIVGPNGSGKSNISDAIRWVLGEQSPKMLRGGKMEEVIFAGTANRKSRGMAEVTLVIDNSTGILPIEYNEVAITRRMYRSGESEYLINSNPCRLRDIKELIMDTGIGVDGYSLIGQGKIADIVSTKPEARREIFEEAAGIVMYKTKKQEAERKLDSTKQNLERVDDIINELDSRIPTLKEESTKAKEYIELRDRFKELEINITLKNVEKLASSNEAIKEDVDELGTSITSLQSRKKDIDQKLITDREKNDNLEQLRNEANEKLLSKITEINALSNKSQLDSEKIAGIDRDIDRLNNEISELTEKLERESQNIDEIEQSREDILKNVRAEEENLKEKIDAYNQAQSISLNTESEIDDMRNLMYDLSSKASSKRSEANSMKSMKDNLLSRKAILESEGQASESSNETFNQEISKAEKEREENNLKKEKNLKEQEKKKAEQEELSLALRNLSKESEDLRIRSEQLTSRKKTIEEMEKNYEGYNGAVRFIMNANLKGIEGVLGELMKVPSGYEIAIETALGQMMQNIICATDTDAKRAISMLKEARAGRLTFLPVESVSGKSGKVDSVLERSHGFKGMAVDLISFDPRYKGIFNYALGKVAIVDNMDTAISLSKNVGQAMRFVTLEGEIINQSGAITGGKYKNQTANLLARRSEIEKLAKEIEELKKSHEAKELEINKKTDYSIELADELLKLSEEGKNLEIFSFNIETKLKTIIDSAKDLMDSQEKIKRELDTIENDLANCDKLTEEAFSEADNADIKIKEVEIDIEAKLMSLETQREEVKAKSEEITKARIKKTEWDQKNEGLDAIMERIQDSIDDCTEQIDIKTELLDELEEKKNKIMFGSGDSEELYQRLTSEKKHLEEYIARVTGEKTELSDGITKMAKEQSELNDTLNSYQDQKYQQEIKLAKNETQLDTVKEKLWEEFEISYQQALEMKKEDFVFSSGVKESREIKNRLRELGDVNVGSIKEYDEVSERYEFMTGQRDDIVKAMNELNDIITDMDRTIKVRFKENFDKVVVNFEDIFKELFGGGHAELRLDNDDNPLEAGIEIIAQPPGKKLQNINLMSGGEKTMTAIALMFAVLKTKPTPFCILDEVEAALDDSNIDRFANYLKHFTEIQFAIVTHQKVTMEHADVLYGVTMPEQGISKVLSLRLGDNFEI